MDCSCVRHTELPHTSKLFEDLLYHPDRLERFYSYPVPDAEAFAHAARQIDLPPERRSALVAALRSLNPESANLELLSREGTVAVVTGQQVGLFSGPAYTIYKALTAVKLARDLVNLGITAVPVFWLATEDHDFEEVNHAWVFDSEHRAAKLEMRRAAAGQPVGEVPLVHPPVAELRQALAQFPFGEEVSQLAEHAYQPGQTLGAAFGTLLRSLLERFDIIQVDPMAAAVRDLAAPTIRVALERAPELTSGLLERNRELVNAGYHAQVHVEDKTSLVFLLENDRRLTLRRKSDQYVLNGRRFTAGELGEQAHSLSPNALLRPVIQDAVLPTVAYIGGPAELAYLAQAEVLYRVLLGRMPVVLPRAGFTILDTRSKKLMARYDLRLDNFFHGEEVLREHIARRLIPPALAGTLSQTKNAMDAALDRLGAELPGFDVTLASSLDKSRKKILYQLSKMERKIGRETLARDARAGRDAGYLSGLVYPQRHLQERLYSILPFLAKHGTGLIDQLYDHLRLECPDHQLLVV